MAEVGGRRLEDPKLDGARRAKWGGVPGMTVCTEHPLDLKKGGAKCCTVPRHRAGTPAEASRLGC